LQALATYRMAKGLCKKCGEKWSRGHKCVDSVQLNIIQEVWNLIDDDSQSLQDSGETTTLGGATIHDSVYGCYVRSGDT
jgi:hypothetical protein